MELEHKKEIFKVIERQAVEWSDLLTIIDNSVEVMSTKARTMVGQDRKQNQERPNSKYTNKRGSPLAVRDVVTILMTAGVTMKGDLVRMDFFWSRHTSKTDKFNMNLKLIELDTEY